MKVAATVVPRAGTAVLFNHDTLHEGLPVLKGKKYIVRTVSPLGALFVVWNYRRPLCCAELQEIMFRRSYNVSLMSNRLAYRTHRHATAILRVL
jgi:hypothetical protein